MTLPPAERSRNMDSKALVFLHVPKTAGSTLRSIIQHQYPEDRSLRFEGAGLVKQYEAFQAMPEDMRRRLNCVVGHMPYGAHCWLPQGARYITMLRDPVEWTLSFHAYMRRMPFLSQNPDFAAFRGVCNLDLDGFLDFLVHSNMVNLQTRVISGQIVLLNLLPPYEPMTNDALDRAKYNLRVNFECVGVVERFDESLLVMKRKLGWGKIYYRRLNVSEGRGGRTELPRAILDRILECHCSDVELYDEAFRLLSAEIEANGAVFQKELRRFRRNNAIYSRLVPIYEASGLYRVRRALRRGLEAVR